MYITERKLRQYAGAYTKSLRENVITSERLARLRIFLSHSHRDRELIEGLSVFLASQGISLYVDWQDALMPAVTNRDTAIRIKQRIEELDLFMVLATQHALASRWVPWEIGVADSLKAWEKIILVPVTDDNGNWTGNEYLQIYQRIEEVNTVPMLLLPSALSSYGNYGLNTQGKALRPLLEGHARTPQYGGWGNNR